MFGAEAPQVFVPDKWRVITSPLTNCPLTRFAGSVIEMGLIDADPLAGSVTAGVFDVTLYHWTVAGDGTVKFETAPMVE
jgi:ubiquinone biosynthesis protein UbiJ